MDVLTVKLPAAIKRRLKDKARRMGRPASELARDLIQRALDGEQAHCHDFMKPACGHAAGSKHASSKEGFGA